jgi:NAD(P)-dependent dehydrogenase (short-subunit alcohol dehydrogenase family)
LAAAGAKVVVADIDMETAEKTATSISASGGIAHPMNVDIGSYTDLKRMISLTVDMWGGVDYLVNNAFDQAKMDAGGVLDVDEEGWERGIHAVISAVFAASKYVIPVMRERGGGAIVNISSVHGLLVARKAILYETGKAAVIAMTKQMAVDYGEFGIRVNAICPGHIVTERVWESTWKDNPEGLKFFDDQYPVGRSGVPQDIGNAVTFLLSDEASFITGHALPVDGGLTIQLQENFGVQQVHFAMNHPDAVMPYER